MSINYDDELYLDDDLVGLDDELNLLEEQLKKSGIVIEDEKEEKELSEEAKKKLEEAIEKYNHVEKPKVDESDMTEEELEEYRKQQKIVISMPDTSAKALSQNKNIKKVKVAKETKKETARKESKQSVELTSETAANLIAVYGNTNDFLKIYGSKFLNIKEQAEKTKIFDIIEEATVNINEKIALYHGYSEAIGVKAVGKKMNKMEDMEVYEMVGRADLFTSLFEEDAKGFKDNIAVALLSNENIDADTKEAIEDMLGQFVVDFAKETAPEITKETTTEVKEEIKETIEAAVKVEDAVKISKEKPKETKKAEIKETAKIDGNYKKGTLKTGTLPGFD